MEGAPRAGRKRKRLRTVIRMGSQPSERVPGPGPLWSTAPKMKEMRNTNAAAIVLSAVVTNPSGALSAGNMMFLRKGTQPTTRPAKLAIVGGGATLLNQESAVRAILAARVSCQPLSHACALVTLGGCRK